MKENNLGIANEMLASAVNLDPNNAEIYVRRASVRKLMGDHNGAVDDLILAISSDNKHPKAMTELLDYGNTNYPPLWQASAMLSARPRRWVCSATYAP